MSTTLDLILNAAMTEEIFPPDTKKKIEPGRPWPVAILTALGAWLAALPLLGLIVVLLVEPLFGGPWIYVVALFMLGGSIAPLRLPTLPLFVEQLVMPMLLTAGATLTAGFFRDTSLCAAAFLGAMVAGGVAALFARHWLRVVLGAASCLLTGITVFAMLHGNPTQCSWVAIHVAVALWPIADQHNRTYVCPLLDRFCIDWVLVAIAGLAGWSGMTFLAGASMSSQLFDTPSSFSGRGTPLALQLASVAATAAAAGLLSLRWPSLRTLWFGPAAALMACLAGLMPTLGASLLILAACATTGRCRIAVTAGVAAAWIAGAFYINCTTHWRPKPSSCSAWVPCLR